MSLLLPRERELDYFDRAVLPITSFSDINESFKNNRRFLECIVSGKIMSVNGEDERYQVRCAEDLRDEPYSNGMFPQEAQPSIFSPLLMTWGRFDRIKNDPFFRRRWLKELEEAIVGTVVPKELKNWHKEANQLIIAQGMTVEEAIADLYEDFSPDRMNVIRYVGYF